jgi:hypothetical protein
MRGLLALALAHQDTHALKYAHVRGVTGECKEAGKNQYFYNFLALICNIFGNFFKFFQKSSF